MLEVQKLVPLTSFKARKNSTSKHPDIVETFVIISNLFHELYVTIFTEPAAILPRSAVGLREREREREWGFRSARPTARPKILPPPCFASRIYANLEIFSRQARRSDLPQRRYVTCFETRARSTRVKRRRNEPRRKCPGIKSPLIPTKTITLLLRGHLPRLGHFVVQVVGSYLIFIATILRAPQGRRARNERALVFIRGFRGEENYLLKAQREHFHFPNGDSTARRFPLPETATINARAHFDIKLHRYRIRRKSLAESMFRRRDGKATSPSQK